MVDRPYGRPADTEASVIRRNVPWLTANAESSVRFSPLRDLHAIIAPNGLFFERHHAGRPDVDPAQHKLMIHGRDERLEPTVGSYWPFAPNPMGLYLTAPCRWPRRTHCQRMTFML